MDDRTEHYFTAVGQLLDHAALGHLRVTLELVDGGHAAGIPAHDVSGKSDEFDDSGHGSCVTVGGDVVALGRVRRATLEHPDRD